MSLSRSPSPQPGGGWASPALSTPSPYASGSVSPRVGGSFTTTNGSHNVTWGSAQARSDEVRSYSSRFNPRGGASGAGFFSSHLRRLSQGLPFAHTPSGASAEKQKLERNKWAPRKTGALGGVPSWIVGRLRFMKLRFVLVLAVLFIFALTYLPPFNNVYNHALGGGNKFVIILAANVGGGVMEWKGPREWAIERDSVKNKKRYARKWGYELEIVDMSTKKRYAHEWRESWEKVDTIRNAMRKYPKAEWFWWLDLNTFIMEPSYSLQEHIFKDLQASTYRDVNEYNPLNISHPLTEEWLDPISRSVDGDGSPESINLIVPQDCGGFNLGSFFVRRSAWTDRLMDIWWDPVHYEQRHMQWEHKEQDALEYMYQNQPWVRSNMAFIHQRKVNAFPPGACSDNGLDPRIHYSEEDRDFVVNMAGCEWGRDCWGEMYSYRELSKRLNAGWWDGFKAWMTGEVGRFRGGKDTDPADQMVFQKEHEEEMAKLQQEQQGEMSQQQQQQRQDDPKREE
ncbi:glycosyltransferase family 34 protein [Diplodia corticola]|uniref:Glycosyltransferase family 34 protein n=1 Tax=Diplodia corticola TaxID=236234 RepID=A0A1J9RZP2_9PEZI|nr:glycosyltransferase family 34 protein [Diplodia corticola]OJD33815.1 glycosyltransferase family 34 protein [Diplodia corticola]